MSNSPQARYERLKRLHPHRYEYAVRPLDEGGLGVALVLDTLWIPY